MLRCGWMVVALGLAACGDDEPGDASTSTTTSSESGAPENDDDSADSMQPCQSYDSRLTVFLADETAEAFVVEIIQGVTETVTCPDGTIDGDFTLVECGVGQVTVEQPDDFWTILWIRVDGGAQEMVVPTCEDSTMCPQEFRNVCEVHLDGDSETTGSSSTSG